MSVHPFELPAEFVSHWLRTLHEEFRQKNSTRY